MNIKNFFNNLINPNSDKVYNFSISNNVNTENFEIEENIKNVFTVLNENLDFLKSKYNTLINNDVIIREFNMPINNKNYKCFIIYIDGLVDSISINDFILKALMIDKRLNSKDMPKNIGNYVDSCLLPQNSVSKVYKFTDVYTGINMGDCLLFIDTLNMAFDIYVKKYSQRSIDAPNN